MATEYDYSKLAATAERLIKRFGRSMEVRLQLTAPDPTKPWTPGTQTEQVTPVKGVFTKIDEKYIKEELVEFGDQFVLVAGTTVLDVSLKGTIKDTGGDGSTWKIVRIKPVKPGTQMMLYKIQVRQ